ncbi:hypothetical protein MRB53_032044 [Persea americana]|uniref:Uncharacterized protein n=1 Tax=Persea americana TaxID=3435 RepID=A0ACC2KR45_PERAE|nr:hypothetical protein MRB53_032044 [Persea americana]
MQLSFTLVLLFSLLLLTSLHPKQAQTLSTCRDTCGTVGIKYPFGLDDGCGAPEYRNMLTCNATDLFFQTPSGLYRVRSIDYDKRTVVIFDPGMSTCNLLQPRHDFSLSDTQVLLLPPSSDSAFALLNCSADSPVLNRYKSLCSNFSGHSCDELYTSCAAFRLLRSVTGVYQPCCFTEYSTLRYMSMNILDCTHYTTVYGLDDLKGVGPVDWTYGIELSYGVPDAGCEHCERTGGTCGFNTETQGMICMCSSMMNTTRDCGKAYQLQQCLNSNSSDCGNPSGSEGRRPSPMTLFHVVILVFGLVLGNIL